MLNFDTVKNIHDLKTAVETYSTIIDDLTLDKAIALVNLQNTELAESLTAELKEVERIAEISKTAIRTNYSNNDISQIVSDVIVTTLSTKVDKVDVSIDNAEFLSAITADAKLIAHKLDKHIIRHYELDSMTDTLSESQLKMYKASTHQRINTRCLVLSNQQDIVLNTHFLRDLILSDADITPKEEKARQNNKKDDSHSIHHTINFLLNNNKLSQELVRHFKRSDVTSSRAQYIIDFDYNLSSDFNSAVELLSQLESDINNASDLIESQDRRLNLAVLVELSINLDSRYNKAYNESL